MMPVQIANPVGHHFKLIFISSHPRQYSSIISVVLYSVMVHIESRHGRAIFV